MKTQKVKKKKTKNTHKVQEKLIMSSSIASL